MIAVFFAVGYFMNSAKPSDTTPLSSQTSQSKHYIALNESSTAKLKQILNSNVEAKNLYQQILSQANKALSQEPNPISEIQSSKVLKVNPIKTQSLKSVKDADKVYALGFSYAVSGDATYARKIQRFMLAWAKTNKPSGDPINTRLLEPMFMGYDIVRNTFNEEDRNTVDIWLNDSYDDRIHHTKSKTNRLRGQRV